MPIGPNQLGTRLKEAIDSLLQQGRHEAGTGDFDRTRKQLVALTEQAKVIQQKLSHSRQHMPQGPGTSERTSPRPT